MPLRELEKFLYDQIPLTTALEITIEHADDASASVKAPLHPNRNHMGTAFGGSLNAVMVLAGYAWLFRCLQTRGHQTHVVLKKSSIEYLLPVATDFRAVAYAPPPLDFEKFLNNFERKRRARVHVFIEIDTPSGIACRLNCEFVAGDYRAAESERNVSSTD